MAIIANNETRAAVKRLAKATAYIIRIDAWKRHGTVRWDNAIADAKDALNALRKLNGGKL